MIKSTLSLAAVVAILCVVIFWQPAEAAGDADYSNWLTDLPKALAKAKAEHKYVFVDFTGSDWCDPCKLVHKKVLSTKEFQKFAQTNLVLMVVDFPERKKQSDELQAANKALKDKYSVDGFPTLMLLDADGNAIYTMPGYKGEKPADFIANLKSKLPKT
jgi:protein disulfide-isomerase